MEMEQRESEENRRRRWRISIYNFYNLDEKRKLETKKNTYIFLFTSLNETGRLALC